MLRSRYGPMILWIITYVDYIDAFQWNPVIPASQIQTHLVSFNKILYYAGSQRVRYLRHVDHSHKVELFSQPKKE